MGEPGADSGKRRSREVGGARRVLRHLSPEWMVVLGSQLPFRSPHSLLGCSQPGSHRDPLKIPGQFTSLLFVISLSSAGSFRNLPSIVSETLRASGSWCGCSQLPLDTAQTGPTEASGSRTVPQVQLSFSASFLRLAQRQLTGLRTGYPQNIAPGYMDCLS